MGEGRDENVGDGLVTCEEVGVVGDGFESGRELVRFGGVWRSGGDWGRGKPGGVGRGLEEWEWEAEDMEKGIVGI